MNSVSKLCSAIALLVACVWSAGAEAVTPNFSGTKRDGAARLIAPRLTTAPQIDGKLDDAAWDQAATVNAFWLAGTDDTASDQTVAWIGFDQDNLYVAYACQDSKIKGDAEFPRDAKQLWMNDAVEVHLSPTRDPKDEYQFILGVGGSRFDRHTGQKKYDKQLQWNPTPDWEGSTSKTEYGYTTEIRIPLDALVDREKVDIDRGTLWKLKLTRLDYGNGKGCLLSSWSMMGTHTSDRFSQGDLVFEDANLLTNGSAELVGEDGRIQGWDISRKKVDLTLRISANEPTDGAQCAAIEIRGKPQGGINSRVYAGGVAGHRQSVEATYRFTADVQSASQPGALASYFIVFNGKELGQLKYKHNAGWQKVEALITVEPGQRLVVPALQSVPTAYQGATEPGGIVYFDNVRIEQIELLDQTGDPDAVCLTGNAVGAFRTRNQRANGRYTYAEPGIDSPNFPNWLRGQSHPEPHPYIGWINFDEGLLTDGLTATEVKWSGFWTGSLGHEIVFDLGKEYEVTRVVTRGRKCAYGSAWVKSPGEQRYTLAAANFTLFDFDTGTLKSASDAEIILRPQAQRARWVRVQVSGKWTAPSEIQIWGKPVASSGPVARKPLLQNDGKTPIKNPVGKPVSIQGVPAVFPVPQKMERAGSPVVLKDGMTIAYAASGGDRAKTTAQVLAEELNTEFGLKLKIVASSQGDIVLGESDTAPSYEQGYRLSTDGSKIRITGHDPRGTFYGCMTLLSLVELNDAEQWQVPGARITDWPTMKFRYIQGRPIPDKGLVRALARFRITHYEAQHRHTHQMAQWDTEAERYFVSFVPHLDPNTIVLRADQNLAERAPGESLADMGHGRRNANPAHLRTWEIYEAECEKWLSKFHGKLVHVNLDETYQFQGGARWNVSRESRAMNMHAGELLAWFINRLDQIVKRHGKTLVMHDTAFMHNHTLSYAGDPKPGWLAALPHLPKDLIFLNWHPDRSTQRLKSAGYRQLYLSLAEKDWRTFDMLGDFDGVTAYMAESSFTPNKLINIAGVTWNPDAPRPNDPVAVMTTAAKIPEWNSLHLGVRPASRYASPSDYHPIDISQAANRSRIDKTAFDGKGFVDLGANMDLRALKSGLVEMAGTPFQIIDESANGSKSFVMVQNAADASRTMPTEVSIDINDTKAASLIFLHCLEHRPGHNYLKRNELAGFYHVIYEDGTYATCDIRYAVNTANWTGRPVRSGYNPKSHNMTDGSLVWTGKTMSGLDAFLYATEWQNPRPDKIISQILLRTPPMKSNMNPMLFAVTAVDARLAPRNEKLPQLPSIDLIQAAKPIGKPIDLTGGRDESYERYVAPDGTVISCKGINNHAADNTRWDVIEHWSYIGMINHVGPYLVARAGQVQYELPKAKQLTGLLITPDFRGERKTENFPRAVVNLYVERSDDDGKTWQLVGERQNVCPEEHAPVWIAFNNSPVRLFRVRQRIVSGSNKGFQKIELFEQ